MGAPELKGKQRHSPLGKHPLGTLEHVEFVAFHIELQQIKAHGIVRSATEVDRADRDLLGIVSRPSAR